MPRMKFKDHRGRKVGVMELSRSAKISAAHISKIASGERNPSLETFVRIANALKVGLDNLYMQVTALQAAPKHPKMKVSA